MMMGLLVTIGKGYPSPLWWEMLRRQVRCLLAQKTEGTWRDKRVLVEASVSNIEVNIMQ
jgi:hypothetical protein